MALEAAFKRQVDAKQLAKQLIDNPINLDGLHEEQCRAFNTIRAGKNVFLTGPGGTGKSYFLDRLVKEIPRISNKKIAVTAMTGCAAVLLGNHAKTLHSWAGIGLGKASADELIKTMKHTSKENWKKTHILVIDEISMMTAELFEKLDAIGRSIRKKTAPFGGLQIVLVGDFYQLPPVRRDISGGDEMLFETKTWINTVQEIVEFSQIYRQRDPVFQEILLAARQGKLTADHLAILEARRDLNWKQLHVKPTLIFSRKEEVDKINTANMRAIKSDHVIFDAQTIYSKHAPALPEAEIQRMSDYYDRDAQYSVQCELAAGAQVMLISNLDSTAGLVNGSRGIILRFVTADSEFVKFPSNVPATADISNFPLFPLVEFANGETRIIGPAFWGIDQGLDGENCIYRAQIPLRLAWATTIHKAQGASLDCALVDVGRRTFEYGQAYVALSRVRSLDALYIWDLDPAAFKTHSKVRAFYDTLKDKPQ